VAAALNLRPSVRGKRGLDAIVIHSGGMDSSICLALACREFGADRVLSMTFDYGQRHSTELAAARRIAERFAVGNEVVPIDCLKAITWNALLDPAAAIEHPADAPPNTLVVGRNGLMVRIAAIHAEHLGAHYVYTGVIEVESANSGYRDCSREYMDKMEEILRMDLDDPRFEVRTPVVKMTKRDTMELADRLGVLDFLLRETVTCYEGIRAEGCGECPACSLRAAGLAEFLGEFASPDRL
jgi:7-cyano-7-deazaguanine synthase